MLGLRRLLALVTVLAATCAGGYLALVSYHARGPRSAWARSGCRSSPGHTGALDVYVPLVDWGARFEAIRAPCGSGSTCRPSTAPSRQSLAEGRSLDVAAGAPRGARRARDYLRG